MGEPPCLFTPSLTKVASTESFTSWEHYESEGLLRALSGPPEMKSEGQLSR